MRRILALAVVLWLVLFASSAEAQNLPSSRPDLVISFEGIPSVLSPEQPLDAGSRAVVRNIGNGIARGNRVGQIGYSIDVLLSTDNNVPEDFTTFSERFREDVLLRGGRVSNTSNLTGGASATFDIENDTIPADTPDGNYQLCARVDPGNVIAETREDNNVVCQQVRVARASQTKISVPVPADFSEQIPRVIPRFSEWLLRSETTASRVWELVNDSLTLHTLRDKDRIIISGLPPTLAFRRATPSCQPRLEVFSTSPTGTTEVLVR